MDTNDTGIIWFRQDLRMTDQPALAAAASAHRRIVPLYIWAPEEEGEWAPGAAAQWWLHESLQCLQKSLRLAGSELIIRVGASIVEILDVIKATGARSVYWNARYEPAAVKRDENICRSLRKFGIEACIYNGSLLREPGSILSKARTPYLVYGAFWRNLVTEPISAALPTVRKLPPLPFKIRSVAIERLGLKPRVAWDQGLRKSWEVGEDAARKMLADFCRTVVDKYVDNRDIPGISGTSQLSPHLHFGELSPRQVWVAARKGSGAGATTYCKQIAWREFSYYLLHHHPRLATEPLRPEFKKFPWKTSASRLSAWQRGLTGYPIVDAGMRELWQTGWMHNRVRMIAASFLVKDLRIHWLKGARWFWDTLVDADLANNTQGWQWTSGCGADAAPFFRIFNPTLQGKKFDPDGAYVRRWVPELAKLPNTKIHSPWESVESLDYPRPIVDHGTARFEALMAYDDIKNKKRVGAIRPG
jgi:deoxyribodipyrimidine photo-lyase